MAIRGVTDELLLRLLVSLDGVADRLLLVPAGVADADFLRLSREAGADLLVAGRGPIPEVKEIGERGPAALPAATRWLLLTSGTTGVPRLVGHTFASLFESARVAPLGPAFTWGLLFDPARFAGVQVLLQALLGGSRLVLSADRRDLPATLAEFGRAGVNALSATPSLWRKLLLLGAPLELKQITLGGEIADQGLLDALHQRFPGARLAHVFAATETGRGFSVADGRAGFPAELVRRGQVRVSPAGGLQLRKPGSEEFMDTGDLVQERDGRFFFRGRIDGMINVGGDKVAPEEVETFLRTLPEVADARVFGRRSPLVGQLVAAEVVLRTPSAAAGAAERILRECRRQLPAFKVPVQVEIVAEILPTAAGKIERGDHGI